jgi:hypothetical protein
MRFRTIPGLAGILFLLLKLLLTPDSALGQSTSGSLNSQTLLNNYDRFFRVDSRLISGSFYQDPTPKSTDGHPYYGAGEWNNGSVVIKGVEFDTLQLRYDIYTNQVIINTLHFNNAPLQVALNKLYISGFTMNGRKFIPFPTSAAKKGGQFCEVLSDGPATLLLMQSKSLIVPANGNATFSFDTYSRMYLFVQEELKVYKGKSTLLSTFPEYKSLLLNFIRTEKLKFRSGKFDSHARLVNYCNTLLTARK